jgi:hypothetical protein
MEETQEKSFHCEICDLDLTLASKSRHMKSFKHILKRTTLEEEQKESGKIEVNNITITSTEPTPIIKQNTTDYLSLDDLRNDCFVETPIAPKEDAKKKTKKDKPKYLVENDDESVLTDNRDLFSADKEKPTLLFGKENLELLHKIKQYKVMFKEQLGKFRIKKRATTEELKNYIEEMDTIVNLASVDTFVIDAILATISTGETVTRGTRYDISGLSGMLRMNPQFNLLAKQ